jgi:hypothetical protein
MHSLPPTPVKDVIRDSVCSEPLLCLRASVNGLDNASETAQARERAPCFDLVKSAADSTSLNSIALVQDGGV